MFQKSNRRGFYLIGLLMCLVIIGYLTYGGYFSPNSQGVSTYQNTMNKTNNAECLSNRAALRPTIVTWQMSHTGETPTIEALAKTNINIPKCRDKGVFSINAAGELFCSFHYPDPDQTPAPASP